jgi:hypothetical protein
MGEMGETTRARVVRALKRNGAMRWEALVAKVYGTSHYATQDRRFQNEDILGLVADGTLKESWDEEGNTYLSV